MDELIRKQAVIDAIHDAYMNAYDEKSFLDDAVRNVRNLPTVTLDKIIAEIDLLSDSTCNGTNVTIYSWNGMKRKVLDIINKYKAESEE